jgi:pimeloyl-ACP methyl ester carboxylesterase
MPPAQGLIAPLAFIHGIKGSVLSDAKGEVRWITWQQAFGLSSSVLSLPLQWNGAVQQRDDLVAQTPLRKVAWQAIYAPFLDWVSASGRAFRPFAYDWRRDNLENTAEFIKFLENVSRESDGGKIQVVAHSMGGLITFAALNRRPDLFHSVLFAGVPFGHSISFLGDMHVGTATGLNPRILSPLVLFTFASIYSLFPTNERDSGLVEENSKGISHDWYSADDWERNRLGLFGNLEPALVAEEQRAHLRHALDRAREFRQLLVRKEEESFRYPPLAVLAGDTRPTLSAVVRGGPHAVRGWDFRTASKKSGDGRVAFSSALPPQGMPCKVYKTSREHAELLNDTHQIAEILAQLLEGCQ